MPNQRSASKVAITVYIDRTLKASVEATAKERGETITGVIANALREYVR